MIYSFVSLDKQGHLTVRSYYRLEQFSRGDTLQNNIVFSTPEAKEIYESLQTAKIYTGQTEVVTELVQKLRDLNAGGNGNLKKKGGETE